MRYQDESVHLDEQSALRVPPAGPVRPLTGLTTTTQTTTAAAADAQASTSRLEVLLGEGLKRRLSHPSTAELGVSCSSWPSSDQPAVLPSPFPSPASVYGRRKIKNILQVIQLAPLFCCPCRRLFSPLLHNIRLVPQYRTAQGRRTHMHRHPPWDTVISRPDLFSNVVGFNPA